MVKLSKRLQIIANYITPGSRVADIGSDHALLPVYLLQSGISPAAIAGELNDGPFKAAQKQVAAAGLSKTLSVRQGNGLAVLEAGEADTVTIAGMGGSLMSDILAAGQMDRRLDGVRELVLQPNVGEDIVRRWLLEQNWYLTDETILEEDGKIYEVLHAVKHQDASAHYAKLYNGDFLAVEQNELQVKDLLLRMGPHLLRHPKPELVKKWQLELNKLERICRQLEESRLPESGDKLTDIRLDRNAIEEVLRCLRTDIPSSN